MRRRVLNKIYDLAKNDKRIIYIGSDVGYGVMDEMKKNYPEQFIMEGISEQHIIGMSAGMAMEGFIPYINTIATFFSRRALEQIIIDICLHNLPVRLIANGGGLVYAPLGPTHQAIDDISILRTIPNLTILSPCDAVEIEKLTEESVSHPNPIYFRLGKGGDEIITKESQKIEIGKAVIKKSFNKTVIFSCGIMSQIALAVSSKLSKNNIDCGVIHFNTIKPIDKDMLKKVFDTATRIITLEENFISGGFGSLILENYHLSKPKSRIDFLTLGIEDRFISKYGSQDQLLDHCGLSPEKVHSQILKFIKND